MGTLIVGDQHGRYELAEAALATEHDVVFVGDYLDSFNRSIEDQIKTLMTVLDAVEDEPHRVTGLFGNHELSYTVEGMGCSGFKGLTHWHVTHLEDRMRALKNYTYVGEFLVSHAGVSQELLEAGGMCLNDYLEDQDFYQIGYARGGCSPIGGLFWCDWFKEFEPLKDTPQIVGHSGYRPAGEHGGIICKGNSYNVDCFEHSKEFLLLGEGEPQVIKLEDL